MQLSLTLLEEIAFNNPWLVNAANPVPETVDYQKRIQEKFLMDPEWDRYCILIIGPRRAGKTTLGYHLSHTLLHQKRFDNLLYLNCDLQTIRTQLTPTVIIAILKYYHLQKPILFIDEAQRLENPGLLLKALIDLHQPIKLIVSGSSQRERKGKISESMAGNAIESLVLPP